MTIIALSGVGNTGKSTFINGNNEIGGIIENLRDEGRQIKAYGETARELFYLLPTAENNIKDYTLFQQAIQASEINRLKELYQDKLDGLNVIVDRTYKDNEIYADYNHKNGKCEKIDSNYEHQYVSKHIYDLVILFTEPMKTTKFQDEYNDPKFINEFNDTIRQTYGNKVFEVKNGRDNEAYVKGVLFYLFTNRKGK